MTSVTAAPTDLRRELGLLDATMINVGTMIASAIFIVPATVAALIPGSGAMVLVWVLGGLVSLLGALSIAELSAAYPEAGGHRGHRRRIRELPRLLRAAVSACDSSSCHRFDLWTYLAQLPGCQTRRDDAKRPDLPQDDRHHG